MKVCIMSDSHGERELIETVVTRHPDCDMYLHAGDHANDTQGLAKFVTVSGNCDLATDAPAEQLVELDEIRLFITHGHRYQVKETILPLSYRAVELSANIVVFGHSHIPTLTEEAAVVYVNPGSLAYPRGGFSTGSYAIVDVVQGESETRILVTFFTVAGEPLADFQLEHSIHKP